MQKIIFALLVVSLFGCSSREPRRETFDAINAELNKAIHAKSPEQTDAVSAALLPPIKIEVPPAQQPIEERFGVTFNNVPAAQFFMGIVAGTRYSMLVHPDVTGTISVNLKDVTVFEALDAVRELYGYDYKVEGTRIYIKPLTLQTRVFNVNYLTGTRKGTSDIRVTSGSVADTNVSGTIGSNANTQAPGTSQNPTGTSQALNTSKISTSSTSDFWSELRASLEAIVGVTKEGRSVVISPQSGVIVVRAMWDEMRNVAAYLKATQLSVDRQVILDAKILEVELNEGFQSGVNWAAFRIGGDRRASAGFLTPGTSITPLSSTGSATALSTANTQSIDVLPVGAIPGASLAAGSAAAGSLFGLAFQTSNFGALISFLETQGTVHVLSSPRIATLNNQKAVLKVGKDEFFVTNVSTTTTAVGNTSSTSPSVTVQPFFSGVALDVTPQISEDGRIILHIHPSVSNVTTVDKPLNLGTAGTFSLPLASSTISETDSVVRGMDGNIVAIGGLMRQANVSDRSQIPGAGDAPTIGGLFRNTKQVMQKRELVILLKPTVIQGESTWAQDMLESQQRIQDLMPRRGAEQR